MTTMTSNTETILWALSYHPEAYFGRKAVCKYLKDRFPDRPKYVYTDVTHLAWYCI